MTDSMPGISLGLARITHLLQSLRSPHLSTLIVHIAGTNGKGSVAAYISSVLNATGTLKVGRFNSPHLVDEWDCLEIRGRTLDKTTFEQAQTTVNQVNDEQRIGATNFELLTATAFEVFRREKLDVAVVEVGMGGRTDATNVVDSEHTLLSVITSIELDHQQFLGNTISEIALVKAGIVKEGVDVVVAKQNHPEIDNVLQQVAKDTRSTVAFAGEGKRLSETVALPLSPLRLYPDQPVSTIPPLQVRLPLPGSYQLANAAAASLAIQTLRTSTRATGLQPALASITDEQIQKGIEATRWPGRLDWISFPSTPSSSSTRRVLVDGAHNPSSATHLAEYLASLPSDQSPSTLIIGLSSPRPPLSILTPLISSPSSRMRRVICVPFTAPPSMPWIRPTSPSDIAVAARSLNVERVEEAQSVKEALGSLREEESAVVAGSLYLVADVYRFLRARDSECEAT